LLLIRDVIDRGSYSIGVNRRLGIVVKGHYTKPLLVDKLIMYLNNKNAVIDIMHKNIQLCDENKRIRLNI
jgi:hypothetical protein